MTVEMVPNTDKSDLLDFSDSDASEDEKSEDNDKEADDEEMRSLDDAIASLRLQEADAKEELQSITVRIGFLDDYGKAVKPKDADLDTLAKWLRLYDEKRRTLHDCHKTCTAHVADLEKELRQKNRKKGRLIDAREKAEEKAGKAKRKAAAIKAVKRAARQAEKRRLKAEIDSFFPKKVYKVVLTIESSSDDIASGASTPRRLAKGSDADEKGRQSSDGPLPVSLSFSYVTHGALWAPAYNVHLSTPSRSGTIAYRAEFENTTSETWRNTKLMLSTSQTSFSGLADKVPTMNPWHIRLAKRQLGLEAWEGALESQSEKGLKSHQYVQLAAMHTKRNELFGKPSTSAYEHADAAYRKTESRAARFCDTGRGTFGSVTAGFGAPTGRTRGGQSSQLSWRRGGAVASDRDAEDSDDGSTGSGDTMMASALAFQESSCEDHGLTTTYTMPGVRTVGPSRVRRRHLIADLSLGSISLSYILIPKLRAAAFLKARIQNTSPTTLLRGQASLTLDGTFLGKTSIPRASPDETFTLLLGIDPAIQVSYAKPTVRRSSSGIFTKEGSVVYTRSITITNTKLDKGSIDLVVLDQIPVSEDEQLRMSIVEPAGLKVEGDKVKTGEAVKTDAAGGGGGGGSIVRASSSSSSSSSTIGGGGRSASGSMTASGGWGKATATLKKHGEITWNVTLNKGATCRLPLEYEAKIPSTEAIVGLDR